MLRPLTIFDALNVAFRIMQTNMVKFGRIALIAMLPKIIAYLLLFAHVENDDLNSLIIISDFFVKAWAACAIIVIVVNYMQQETDILLRPFTPNAYGLIFRFAQPVLLIIVLAGCVLGLLSSLLIAIPSGTSILFAVIISALMCLKFLYWMLAPVIMIFESHLTLFGGLRKSQYLMTRNRIRYTKGSALAYAVAICFVSIVGFMGANALALSMSIWGIGLSFIIEMFIFVWITCNIAVLYIKQLISVEAFDLFCKSQVLGDSKPVK